MFNEKPKKAAWWNCEVNNEVHIFLIKQWFDMIMMLKGLKKVVLIIEVFFFFLPFFPLLSIQYRNVHFLIFHLIFFLKIWREEICQFWVCEIFRLKDPLGLGIWVFEKFRIKELLVCYSFRLLIPWVSQ
jgi:hypothetical protein